MTAVAPFLKEMEAYIRTSRADVAAGRDVDMSGLDVKIESLCSMVLGLSPEEQMMYEPHLQSLLGDLNSLGLELKEQMTGLHSAPQHRNASVAYKTADSRDNFGKRGEDEA